MNVYVSDAPALRLAETLVELLAGLPEAHVAVSGGTSPRPLFQALAGPLRERVDWARISLYQVDERAVPPTHADANWRMLCEELLRHVPVTAYRLEAERAGAADAYESLLRARVPGNSPPTPPQAGGPSGDAEGVRATGAGGDARPEPSPNPLPEGEGLNPPSKGVARAPRAGGCSSLDPTSRSISRHAAKAMPRDSRAPRAGGCSSVLIPALDIILLGMGADGHTASLFPGTPALDESVRLMAETTPPAAPHRRVTMTFPLLRAARHRFFLVTGADRADAFSRAMMGELPAGQIGDADWYIDHACAGSI